MAGTSKGKSTSDMDPKKRPQDPLPHDGNQLIHGGRQKAGEAPGLAEDEQGEGMPAVGGQR